MHAKKTKKKRKEKKMIINFSNLTDTRNLTVQDRLIKASGITSDSSVRTYSVTSGDYIAFNIDVNNVFKPEIGKNIFLDLHIDNVPANTILKLAKLNNDTSISSLSSTSSIYSEITSCGVFDKMIINKDGTENASLNIVVDLSRFMSLNLQLYPSIPFVIFFENENSQLNLAVTSPEHLASLGEEVCLGVSISQKGYSGIYRYDEHNLGTCGKLRVNLFTGLPVYTMNILSTITGKAPISFSICQNKEQFNLVTYMPCGFVHNYHYNIEQWSGKYRIIDATGYTRYYTRIEYTGDSESTELVESYGIKHLDTSGDLYRCEVDETYIYVDDMNLSVVMYDKADTCTEFYVYYDHVEISKIKSNLGKEINFEWENSRLVSITNSDNDSINIEYDESGNISKVTSPSTYRYALFTYLESEIYSYLNIAVYNADDETDTKVWQTEIKLTNNFISRLTDQVTNYYTEVDYCSINKIYSVGLYNIYGKEKKYLTCYLYDEAENYTKVSGLDGKYLIYMFDGLGRLHSIMDSQNRSVAGEYQSELINGAYKSTGKSKIQCHSASFLDNYSFEHENVNDISVLGWTYLYGYQMPELVDGGINGEKCLQIKATANNDVCIKQIINPLHSGMLVLNGNIKHYCSSEEELSMIKIYMSVGYKTNGDVSGSISGYINPSGQSDCWNEFELQLPMPDDFKETTWVSVEIKIGKFDTTLYIDNFQLRNKDFSTGYNYVLNGHMESTLSVIPDEWNIECGDAYDRSVFITADDIHSQDFGDGVMKLSGMTAGIFMSLNNYQLKKFYQTIPLNCCVGDQFVLNIFAKGYISQNNICNAFVKFGDDKTERFEFVKYTDSWQILTKGVIADRDCNEITVGVEYDGSTALYLDCFSLYKDTYGTYYTYNRQGNICEVIDSANNISRLSYNENNMLSELNMSGGGYKYEYGDNVDGHQGLLVGITDMCGSKVEFDYDASDRLTSTKIIPIDGDPITTLTEYSDTGNSAIHTNKFGVTSKSQRDYLDRVISYTNYNRLVTQYNYNKKDQLTLINGLFLQKSMSSSSMHYDDHGNMDIMGVSHSNYYTVERDTFGRATAVKYQGSPVEQYVYDDIVNGYRNGNLVSKTLGTSGDVYSYVYNDKNQVSEVKINDTVTAKYRYNENGSVYDYHDVLNNKHYYCTYDTNGRLSILAETDGAVKRYSYDDQGGIQKVSYDALGCSKSVEYEHDYEHNEYSKHGLFYRIAESYRDDVIVGGSNGGGMYGTATSYNNVNTITDSEIHMELDSYDTNYNYIFYRKKGINKNRSYSSVNGRSYSYEKWKEEFEKSKTFLTLIKPAASYGFDQTIMSFCKYDESTNRHSSVFLKLILDSSGKLICKTNTEAETETSVTSNGWNLVGIKIRKNDVTSKTEAVIFLNDTCTESFEVNFDVEDVDCMYVGKHHSIDSDYTDPPEEMNLGIPFKICMMTFGAYNYTGDDTKAIYGEAMRAIYDQPSRSNATLFYDIDFYGTQDVVTLNGTFESMRSMKPVRLADSDIESRPILQRMFRLDSETGRYVYSAYSGTECLMPGVTPLLAYKLGLEKKGVISVRFKTEVNNKERCIMHITSTDTEAVRLYFAPDSNKLSARINGQIYTLDYDITDSEWHFVCIGYYSGVVNIIVDNKLHELQLSSVTLDLTDCIAYIGNSADGTSHLCGCMEMLSFSKKYGLISGNDHLIRSAPIVVRNMLNSLGCVTSTEYKIMSNNITVDYSYDVDRPVNAVVQGIGEIYTAEYNKNDRLVKKEHYVEASFVGQEEMAYNELGRLTRYESQRYDTESSLPITHTQVLTYDSAGNITSVTYKEPGMSEEVTLEYVYDSVLKDRLSQVKTSSGEIVQNISYDTDSIFYPISMVIDGETKSLSWQGKRLTAIQGMADGDTTQFVYNESGMRIKKTSSGIEHIYDLDGDKVMRYTRVNSSYVILIDFIYDANGTLISAKTPNSYYFYVRDLSGNIEGLIDKNSNFVIRYKYDAWGRVVKTDILSDNDIDILANPFMYKGYIYDGETGWYYLKSRYYDPSLRRFISPDELSYLNPRKLGELNLYSYCGNNPIQRKDANGHAWYNVAFDWINTIAGILNPISTITAAGALAVAAAQGRWGDLQKDWESGALNPFNQNAYVASNVNVLGFYKGSTVVKENALGTCSIFGTIWLRETSIDAVNHEYGHSVQERILGTSYLTTIAIPSVLGYFGAGINEKLYHGYYSTPWERTADLFGGVERLDHKPNSIAWAIAENLLGPAVIPFYFAYGF